MDPLSLGLGIIGLGVSIFGGMHQAKDNKEQAAVSADEAKQEQGINDLKQQQMELQGQRAQIENTRNIQRARAAGLNAATSQGAQYGSGLPGGQAEATDQGLFNMQGVNQALDIGRGINSFNKNISADKIRMAQLGGQAATDAGIANLGGAIMKAAPIAGAFGKGFGKSDSESSGGLLFNSPWTLEF